MCLVSATGLSISILYMCSFSHLLQWGRKKKQIGQSSKPEQQLQKSQSLGDTRLGGAEPVRLILKQL